MLSSARVPFLCAGLLLVGAAINPLMGQVPVAESKLTALTHPPCKTTHVQLAGANSEQMCPGIGGYKLLLLDSDGRMSVTIVSPDGAKRPLDFWNTVTPHFSTIGKAAEWRIRSGSPSAVIIPLAIQDDPDTGKFLQYRIVIKLAAQTSCMVAKLPATTSAEALHHATDEACPTH